MSSAMTAAFFAELQQAAFDSSCQCEQCRALRAGPAAYIKFQTERLAEDARVLDVPAGRLVEWLREAAAKRGGAAS